MSDQVHDERKAPFFWAHNQLVKDHLPAIGLHAFAVYMLLAYHADSARVCWPAIGTIARSLGVTKPTVRKALTALSAAGLITITERSSKKNGKKRYESNLYTLCPIPEPGGKPDLPPQTDTLVNVVSQVVKDVYPNKNQEQESEKTLSAQPVSDETSAPVVVAPQTPEPEREPAIAALMESISSEPESPPDEPDPPRAPHPHGQYVQQGERMLYGPFNNYSAAHTFALSLAPTGTVTQTPRADLDAIAPAKPGKRTKDAAPGEAPKRDALFKAVARYLSFPDETVTAQYSAVKCRRVNQVKGYVLDVAGRPAKPDYAALAAKLDAFPAWCQNQGFTAPKEETKFTGQFNKFYHNGTGAAALRVAFPVEDFDKRWFNDRHSWYKREGGALLAQSIGATDWRKAREDE